MFQTKTPHSGSFCFVGTMNRVIDTDLILHKWLKVPHPLHVGVDKGPKRPKVTIVFVHGLANSHAMWGEMIDRINTDETRVISVDLLGFGASPKPTWQTYSAKIHARSLRLTLQTLRVRSPVLMVGHSLGSLVSIEYATLYPKAVQSLLLCSPPFYKPTKLAAQKRMGLITQPDDAYHILYRNSRYRVEIAKTLADMVKRAGLMSKYFVVDDATLPAIVSSLEMSIENQTALIDAKKLTIPTRIIYGQFDPFIIKSHMRELAKANLMISTKAILAEHEISGNPAYKRIVIDEIDEFIYQLTLPSYTN